MIIKKVESDEKQKKMQKAKGTHKQISDLVDYICAPHKVNMEEKLEYAGYRNLEGDTHAARKMEMVSLAEKSVRSKMPVSHWIMSWEEDEQPTPEQIERCVDIFLEEMGLQGHQVIFGVHRNTRNIHLHIAVNRMNPKTLKVIQPHKGFDKNAGHRLMTKIEHEQGWKQTGISRYVMLENGEIVRRKREPEIKPRQKALDFEQATGEKSAQRIAQEKGHEIIANARSWEELHAALEGVGLRFEKKHRGAVIWVGDVAVKAYEELYGITPAVKAIHAGLECGLFLTKNPELHMISFGPTLRGVHSPDEKMHIPAVEKFWNHLTLILKKLA